MKEKKSVLFWLSLSQTILIYAFIIASVSVGFSLISHYVDYSLTARTSADGTRFAMAVLIVVTPLIIIIGKIKGNIYRNFSEYSESLIKKWVSYIALFLGGAVLAGDLVAVLYGFFTGELSTEFFLKALLLAVFVAYFFWSMLHDLKKTDYSNKKKSYIDAIVVIVTALILVIGGFVAYGLPQTQRDIKFDNDVSDDLNNIENVISEYISLNDGQLPQSLEKIKEFSRNIGYLKIDTKDPDGNPYTYNPINENKPEEHAAFELCATFRTSTYENQEKSSYPVYGRPYHAHEEGYQCFKRDVLDKSEFPDSRGPIIKPRLID